MLWAIVDLRWNM